jgi:hypothetical protein
VGTRVSWQTNSIHNGRRVRGSTFIVPIASQFYTDQGLISPANLAVLDLAAGELRQNTNIGVFSRPTKKGVAGAWSKITGNTVAPGVSWLRSRRT